MPPTSHQAPPKGLILPTKSLPTHPPNISAPTITAIATATTAPRTIVEPQAPTASGKKRQRPRNIACITCNRQKKTCGTSRPCPRCVHLGIPCQQPIKPPGFVYNTKKQKLSNGPLSPPVSPQAVDTLMLPHRKTVEMGRHQRVFMPQSLPPSPSPSVSTVGTPQDFSTPISSYDDPATGKDVDVIEISSCISSRSMSISNEPSRPLPPPLDIFRCSIPSLPAPAEEVPYDIIKKSLFSGAPIFGLEKSIFDSGFAGDDILAELGDPINMENLYTDVVDKVEIQGTKGLEDGEAEAEAEVEEGRGDKKECDAELGNSVAQGQSVVAADHILSGIASETCGSGIAWLDTTDLLTDELVLDDVDLSNLDISGLDDISIDFDLERLLELSISKTTTPPTLS